MPRAKRQSAAAERRAKSLLDAIENGDTDKVQEALRARVSVNTANVFRSTALILAVENGHYEILQILLERGAKTNTVDKWGISALHVASSRGDENVVRLLLEKKADVNLKGRLDSTPLHYASRAGRVVVVRCLLEHGADVNATDLDEYSKYRNTALNYATREGHEDVVRLLLEMGANVNLKGAHGDTPLHIASRTGHAGISKCLLEHGADVNATDSYMNTVLREAVIEAHKDQVLWLLQNGAKVNILNDDKQTPVDIAKKKEHWEILDILEKYPLYEAALNGDHHLCQRLLDDGTTRDLVDVFEADYLLNPARAALKGGHTKIVNLFLQRKQGINYENILNEKPSIFWAVDSGQVKVVSYLLDCGADPNTAYIGNTILHLATHKRRADLVHPLLLKGAGPNKKDQRGLAPLHYAVMNGDEDIVMDLIKHNADVNTVAPNRDTPLHLAFAGVRHKIGQLLISKGADVEALNSNNETPSDILKHKFAEHQRIAKMMREITKPKNGESADMGNPKRDLEEDDLDSGAGYISESDATDKRPCLAKSSHLNGLTTEAPPVLQSSHVQALQSKMDELMALVLELEDKAVDTNQLHLDLIREFSTISNLQLKLDNMNIRLNKKLKTERSEPKSLTEKQDEAERKKSELRNELTTLRKNISDLNVKKKIIYQEIGQLL